ncbi:hypothetical protein TeGR_g13446 [Tetraparma gracilis]|uniref:Endonuclease/exonuclease/phosphatase domain-containing protein n=1 Tax=Tetraparma gracilis TaxID=2962635 RepID=A0ABQ6MQV6_9STRA|nr:hypothetical protein TeGR_g13446 [Tetraparma gracilis]
MSSPSSFRVFSYNLLSSSLASPSHFKACSPANLDAAGRLPKILAKLEAETAKSSIICLQELSRKWEGPLHVFFEERNYQFVTGLYGRRFNGYMGVAVAWPLSKFKALEVDVQTLADVGDWPRPPSVDQQPPPPPPSKARRSLGFLSRLVTNPLRFLLPPPPKKRWDDDADVYDLAAKRSNILITATLQARDGGADGGGGRPFTMSNYHMPCAFRTPPLMTIHSTLAVRYTKQLAKGNPFLCVGDWNIKPCSEQYETLTTGKLSADPALRPPPKHNITFSPDIGEGVYSAYAVKNGREPDFTNYAKVKDEEPFIDTLDYIFMSKEGDCWTVDAVDDIVHRDDMAGPLPNDEEPSDHVSIAANLQLSGL